jgi:hypothetical protein
VGRFAGLATEMKTGPAGPVAVWITGVPCAVPQAQTDMPPETSITAPLM